MYLKTKEQNSYGKINYGLVPTASNVNRLNAFDSAKTGQKS